MKSTLLSLLVLLSLVPNASKHDMSARTSIRAEKASSELNLSDDEIAKAAISVEAVQLKQVSKSLLLTGTIQPNQTRTAKVLPAVSGRILEVRVQQGDTVQEGQTLALLESVDLGEARANYRQTLSEVVLADAAIKRAEQLSIADIVPKKEYLSAKADAERAHAALTAAQTKLRLFHATPEKADDVKDSASSMLVAPLTGTILEQSATRGAWVPSDQAMFTVSDLNTLWVEADAFEKDLASLTSGMPAAIKVAAYPDLTFSGTLIYISDVLNEETHTLKARIAVANPEHKLKVGMFANITMTTPSFTEPMLTLPAPAVTLIQGQNAVFIQNKKGFEVRVVETAPLDADRLYVKAGLTPGERVVVSGVYELKARLLKSQIGDND